MDELIAQLKELGFTEYEAKAYTALVQKSHISAYQVSKNSGIPRARIYDILDVLVEKGLVLKEEAADQTTYCSIPVEMFLQQIQQRWQSNFTSISDQLEKLESKEQEAEPKVLMLKGRQTIINYCQSLLKKAEKKVLLSMWEEMYEALREDIFEVAEQVAVHGITLYVDEPVSSIDRHRMTYYTKKNFHSPLVYLVYRWARDDLWTFSFKS